MYLHIFVEINAMNNATIVIEWINTVPFIMKQKQICLLFINAHLSLAINISKLRFLLIAKKKTPPK